MFNKECFKTFDLKDLSGRTVYITTLTDKSASDNIVEITVAVDTKTGEMFMLSHAGNSPEWCPLNQE